MTTLVEKTCEFGTMQLRIEPSEHGARIWLEDYPGDPVLVQHGHACEVSIEIGPKFGRIKISRT